MLLLLYICKLKKFAAISFLVIFLCANTGMGELLKLPFLIQHFLEHNADDAGKSFITFLHEHYSIEKNDDAQHKEHEKLPFKSHHPEAAQSQVFCLSSFSFECKANNPLVIKEQNILQEHFHFSSALSKIWQPPRFS